MMPTREKTGKLIILCGLIGSGKTTYAMHNFRHFTDLDHMPLYSRKADQIKQTLKHLERHGTVCHITTYPTDEELLAFQEIQDKQFIWINTSIKQAKTNILIRNRPRDMTNLKGVIDRNNVLLETARRSPIKFSLVNVFAPNEKRSESL